MLGMIAVFRDFLRSFDVAVGVLCVDHDVVGVDRDIGMVVTVVV
jgi:hypothetical protein